MRTPIKKSNINTIDQWLDALIPRINIEVIISTVTANLDRCDSLIVIFIRATPPTIIPDAKAAPDSPYIKTEAWRTFVIKNRLAIFIVPAAKRKAAINIARERR